MAKKRKPRPQRSTGYGSRNRNPRRRRPGNVPRSTSPPEPEVNENGEPLPLEEGQGMLELHPNGYGFLRSPDNNYSRERTDPFVPGTMIDKYGLR